MLALVPARAGSKGLPGKALQPLAGLPLIGHTIELARRCPEVSRIVVSTDSEEIAQTAVAFGADVPFLRPGELARDETPMWPVVRHALDELETTAPAFDSVLLLQPTSPLRLPEDVAAAVATLADRPDADAVFGVSVPAHNPVWAAMVERDGYLERLLADAVAYSRRQDLPRVLEVNGSLYLWRAGVVREHADDPTATARVAPVEIRAVRAVDIDDETDLALAAGLLRAGVVTLPWLTSE